MLRINGSSYEEEKLYAESIGDEKYSRQLDMANECLGIMGWDIEVKPDAIHFFADHYERIITGDTDEERFLPDVRR